MRYVRVPYNRRGIESICKDTRQNSLDHENRKSKVLNIQVRIRNRSRFSKWYEPERRKWAWMHIRTHCSAHRKRITIPLLVPHCVQCTDVDTCYKTNCTQNRIQAHSNTTNISIPWNGRDDDSDEEPVDKHSIEYGPEVWPELKRTEYNRKGQSCHSHKYCFRHSKCWIITSPLILSLFAIVERGVSMMSD